MLKPSHAAIISIIAVLIAGALSFSLWQLFTTGTIDNQEIVMFTLLHAVVDALFVGAFVYIAGRML